MPRTVSRVEVVRVEDGRARRRTDTLAAEEPLEIRVDGRPVSVTMRTPGDDVDLALGFLITEGVVTAATDVATARHCTGQGEPNELNVLDVRLRGAAELPASLQRNFYVTSACGVCGKASIDAVFAHIHRPLHADPAHVAAEVLTELPETLRRAQRVFDRTGGLHAAALFDTHGELACVREDVGRHNAVDKVVGWAAREDRLPLSGTVLLVSGRASFELVQKAAMAGVPVLAAVGAPSGLAASLADEVGMTLVGFLRGPSMNVYTHPHRVGTPG